MRAPAKTEAVLYHYWRSSSSWRVRWALHHKAIPFSAVAVDLLTGEQRQPAYLLKNPQGLVPLLQIDGCDLTESLAIVEYLEETRGGARLLPQAPMARARVRQLAQIICADTQPLQNLSVLAQIEALTGDRAQRQVWAQQVITRGLDAYEALVLSQGGSRGRFSCGDELTLADLCLIPQVYNAQRQGLLVTENSRWPTLSAIVQACTQTASYQASAPEAYQPAT